MKRSGIKCAAVCTALTLLIFMSGCAVCKTHPEFKERQKKIKKIAVMPPRVDAYLVTFKGDNNRLDYLAKIMEKAMVNGVEFAFSQKGYAIKKLELGDTALGKNSDLKTAVFNVNRLFDKALQDIKTNKEGKFAYSLGSDVNTFADLSDSDALVFMRGTGYEKSEGEIAKEVVKAVAVSVACAMVGAVAPSSIKTSAVAMDIVVVDANDGAILWHNFTTQQSNNFSPRSSWEVANLAQMLVMPFPDNAEKDTGKKETESKPAANDIVKTKDVQTTTVMAPPVAK